MILIQVRNEKLKEQEDQEKELAIKRQKEIARKEVIAAAAAHKVTTYPICAYLLFTC